MDLMLTRALGSPAHSREHLVVELKRPTGKDGEKLVSQVKRYARALADDPRWADTSTKWVFLAVTYDLDPYARKESMQRDRPPGMIDVGHNYICWLRTWGSLLEEARARMEFLRQALEAETKKEAGVRYLKQSNEDNMPEIIEEPSGTGRMRQRALKKAKAIVGLDQVGGLCASSSRAPASCSRSQMRIRVAETSATPPVGGAGP
jgi:hypothetical protein